MQSIRDSELETVGETKYLYGELTKFLHAQDFFVWH